MAVIGAGVSGLTCGLLFAERGDAVTLYAEETGEGTTSAAAGAIWFPYDAEPVADVIRWSLATFGRLQAMAGDARTGVAMRELRCFARAGELPIPGWAHALGARRLSVNELPDAFASGFALNVPMIDAGTYLSYLAARLIAAGGSVVGGVRFADMNFHRHPQWRGDVDLVVNCSGVGARELVRDAAVEPHRGQIAIVAGAPVPYAMVCDEPPLMYVIPRMRDCVFGGTNEISDDRTPRPAERTAIVAECARVLDVAPPAVIGERVGLRPFRTTGVRLEIERLTDMRPVLHNYGHGGSGFTLSWGCAEEVFALAEAEAPTVA